MLKLSLSARKTPQPFKLTPLHFGDHDLFATQMPVIRQSVATINAHSATLLSAPMARGKTSFTLAGLAPHWHREGGRFFYFRWHRRDDGLCHLIANGNESLCSQFERLFNGDVERGLSLQHALRALSARKPLLIAFDHIDISPAALLTLLSKLQQMNVEHVHFLCISRIALTSKQLADNPSVGVIKLPVYEVDTLKQFLSAATQRLQWSLPAPVIDAIAQCLMPVNFHPLFVQVLMLKLQRDATMVASLAAPIERQREGTQLLQQCFFDYFNRYMTVVTPLTREGEFVAILAAVRFNDDSSELSADVVNKLAVSFQSEEFLHSIQRCRHDPVMAVATVKNLIEADPLLFVRKCLHKWIVCHETARRFVAAQQLLRNVSDSFNAGSDAYALLSSEQLELLVVPFARYFGQDESCRRLIFLSCVVHGHPDVGIWASLLPEAEVSRLLLLILKKKEEEKTQKVMLALLLMGRNGYHIDGFIHLLLHHGLSTEEPQTRLLCGQALSFAKPAKKRQAFSHLRQLAQFDLRAKMREWWGWFLFLVTLNARRRPLTTRRERAFGILSGMISTRRDGDSLSGWMHWQVTAVFKRIRRKEELANELLWLRVGRLTGMLATLNWFVLFAIAAALVSYHVYHAGRVTALSNILLFFVVSLALALMCSAFIGRRIAYASFCSQVMYRHKHWPFPIFYSRFYFSWSVLCLAFFGYVCWQFEGGDVHMMAAVPLLAWWSVPVFFLLMRARVWRSFSVMTQAYVGATIVFFFYIVVADLLNRIGVSDLLFLVTVLTGLFASLFFVVIFASSVLPSVMSAVSPPSSLLIRNVVAIAVCISMVLGVTSYLFGLEALIGSWGARGCQQTAQTLTVTGDFDRGPGDVEIHTCELDDKKWYIVQIDNSGTDERLHYNDVLMTIDGERDVLLSNRNHEYFLLRGGIHSLITHKPKTASGQQQSSYSHQLKLNPILPKTTTTAHEIGMHFGSATTPTLKAVRLRWQWSEQEGLWTSQMPLYDCENEAQSCELFVLRNFYGDVDQSFLAGVLLGDFELPPNDIAVSLVPTQSIEMLPKHFFHRLMLSARATIDQQLTLQFKPELPLSEQNTLDTVAFIALMPSHSGDRATLSSRLLP